jgi:hypothetical protein
MRYVAVLELAGPQALWREAVEDWLDEWYKAASMWAPDNAKRLHEPLVAVAQVVIVRKLEQNNLGILVSGL